MVPPAMLDAPAAVARQAADPLPLEFGLHLPRFTSGGAPGITYRNVAQLAKIVATLDVLSGGRATCGLGAAWFEREHRLYGYDFPPLAQRYELLEDALRLLPLMWGPGAPAFSGHRIEVPEAVCYPRPLQARIPILVGGGGERRTLRLVAEHADACNLSSVRPTRSGTRSRCSAGTAPTWGGTRPRSQ